jgi:cytochrome P450
MRSCEIGGVKFKKGDIVQIPMYSMQNMEENFPDPEKFDPER